MVWGHSSTLCMQQSPCPAGHWLHSAGQYPEQSATSRVSWGRGGSLWRVSGLPPPAPSSSCSQRPAGLVSTAPAGRNLSWSECVDISRNCAPVQCSKQTLSIQSAPVLRRHAEYQWILPRLPRKAAPPNAGLGERRQAKS